MGKMWTLLLYLFVYLFCNGSGQSVSEEPLVQTKVGLIRGTKATDGDYNMFMGIPYARVNLNNPFGLHLQQPPFEEIFNATNDVVKCVQKSEITNDDVFVDCLQLSVYVPKSNSFYNALPVIVWIHGGSFNSGSGGKGEGGPKFLIRYGVIVVNLNYRLGPYGFMCLDIPEVPGNQGLKDQIAGIKWVKKNIAAFGGDSNKITIMGESAGAGAVDFILRYSEPNLYDKAIMLSGSSRNPWALSDPNYSYAIGLADMLGFKTNNTYSALEFLAAADPRKVISASLQAGSDDSSPCIEMEFASVERLVNEDPAITKMPNARNTSILIGYTDLEQALYFLFPYSEQTFQLYARDLGFTGDDVKIVANLIRQFYVGDASPEEIDYDLMKQYVYFLSDKDFVYPAEQSLEQYIQIGASNIYRYMFTYVGQRNVYQSMLNISFGGAGHSEVNGYLFDLETLDQPINAQDQLMVDRITTMWTNFVKYGDPTPQTSQLLPTKWSAITPEASYFMNIGKDLILGTRPNSDRMAFFDMITELAKSSNNKNKTKISHDTMPVG